MRRWVAASSTVGTSPRATAGRNLVLGHAAVKQFRRLVEGGVQVGADASQARNRLLVEYPPQPGQLLAQEGGAGQVNVAAQRPPTHELGEGLPRTLLPGVLQAYSTTSKPGASSARMRGPRSCS